MLIARFSNTIKRMQNPNMINNGMKMTQNCMPNQYAQIQRPPRMTMPMNNYQNMGQQFRGNPGTFWPPKYLEPRPGLDQTQQTFSDRTKTQTILKNSYLVNNMAMSNVGQMNGQNINMMMANGPNMAPMNSNQQPNMQQQRMGQVLILYILDTI